MINQLAIFIIIPRFDNSSPIKGAVALSNELSKNHDVTIIDIKKSKSNNLIINSNIKIYSLHKYNFLFRIYRYRKLLKKSAQFKKNISISFCLLADLVNSFCNKESKTISSIRGNYDINYKNRFSTLGYLIIFIHFHILNKLQKIFVMNLFMKDNLKSKIKSDIMIFGNFLDETVIHKDIKRDIPKINKNVTFIFSGRLVKLKKIDILINSFAKFLKYTNHAELVIIGNGPEFKNLVKLTISLHIQKHVKFIGYVNNPMPYIVNSDCLVIPSLSEGTSRSALESLFLGVPCIMRDANGNNELIVNKKMGLLFKMDDDLENILNNMYHYIINNRQKRRMSLLLNNNSQQFVVSQIIQELYK